MDIPLRKILKEHYPEQASNVRQPARTWFNKKTMKKFFLVLLVAIVLIKLSLLFLYYNTFLSLQYDVDESKAQIDTQLQRRHNIVNALRAMVRQYGAHERDIFNHATDTRQLMVNPLSAGVTQSKASSAGAVGQPANSGPPAATQSASRSAIQDLSALLSKSNFTSGDLGTLLAIAERYPDPRLSENIKLFMERYDVVENNIAEQRMLYNQRANLLSTELGKFPGFLFARLYGFESPEFFEPDEEARMFPDVGS